MPTVHFGKRPGRTRGPGEDKATADGSVTSEVLGVGGTTEVAAQQTIDTDGTGGTFTLTLGVEESNNIVFNASTGAMETGVETINGVTSVTVTGAAPPWVVQFNDAPLGPVDDLVPDDTLLTGETIGTTVVTTQTGVTNADETQLIVIDGDTGAYTLWYGGQETGDLDETDDAAAVEAALELLSTITGVTVTGSGTRKDPFVVLFVDPQGDASMITSTDGSVPWELTVVKADRAPGDSGDRE